MRAKVVFVTRGDVFGGAEKHSVDLISRLDYSKIEPMIVCYGGDPYRNMLPVIAREAVRIYGGLKWRNAISLWLFLIHVHPDVVVFVDSYRGLFPESAFLAARFSGAKRLYAIEHSVAEDGPSSIKPDGFINRVRRLIGRRARLRVKATLLPGRLCNRTICVSDAVRTKLISEWGYSESSVVTILNGVDLAHYTPQRDGSVNVLRERLGISEHVPIILCVARLSEEKGVGVFLEALSSAMRSGGVFHGIIVGDGPLRRELEKQAKDLGLQSRVVFVGYQDDVRPYYRAATLCVLPSFTEGLPLVLLEAMASGVPCIMNNVGGANEVISHEIDGLLVTPGLPEELVAAIKRLIENEGARRKIALRARERVQSSFNVEVTAHAIQAILLGQRT